jgi:hypothetical protein
MVPVPKERPKRKRVITPLIIEFGTETEMKL